MNKTNIEWTDRTWNPITGCLNHVDGLCKGGGFPCYAYKLAHGRLKQRYLDNGLAATDIGGTRAWRQDWYVDPFYPRLWPERFKPLKGYPEGTKIFLNDMSDWMGPWIPAEWKMQTIDFIRAHPQYIFQTLTKQPQELPKWAPFPDNCWVGVTITKDLLPTIEYLKEIQANKTFISFEPLLGLTGFCLLSNATLRCLDWLIIGACTGTKAEMSELVRKYPDLSVMPYGNRWTAQPKIEWVTEIVSAADKAGVPVFLKDNLKNLLPSDDIFWSAFPFRLRQEFP